jgi:hypothetical protein
MLDNEHPLVQSNLLSQYLMRRSWVVFLPAEFWPQYKATFPLDPSLNEASTPPKAERSKRKSKCNILSRPKINHTNRMNGYGVVRGRSAWERRVGEARRVVV